MGTCVKYILWAALPAVLLSCFRDKGNYDYRAVNEVVIKAPEFDREVINVRINLDRLKITPELVFTLDRQGTGDYEYEWVAVGQNRFRNERFVLGHERDLDCEVKLGPDLYILYLKVKDNSTGLVFSRGVNLQAGTMYSRGWLLAGEDASGRGQMDMLSISRDTLLVKNALTTLGGLELAPVNLVWIENIEYPTEERLYVGSAGRTYKFGREDFTGTPLTDMLYYYTVPEYYTGGIMTDNQKINDKRQVVIIDGYAFVVTSDGGGLLGNPVSTYNDGRYFRVAGRMACNHSQVDVLTMAFFNDEQKEFAYVRGLTALKMDRLPDPDGDPYMWRTKVDFPPDGLSFVNTINSSFGAGRSATVLKHPVTGKHYIYAYTCNRDGNVYKEGRYEVDEAAAAGFSRASHHIMTTMQGYMIYASGSKLYAYDFRGNNGGTLLRDFGDNITAVFNDYVTGEKNMDHFYLTTYRDGVENSGVLYKFAVEDSPDRMAVVEKERWGGLLKVNSIFWKAY